MRETQLLTTTAILVGLSFAMAFGQTEQDQGGKAAGEVSKQSSQQQSGKQSAAADRLKQTNSRQRTAQQVIVERPPPLVLLRDWNYDEIYAEGWSVRKLMDEADVYGPDGDQIGSVGNVIIGSDRRLLGIVAEIGGFLDIADTHAFVPWDQVGVSDGLERVTIPVTEENIESYSMEPDAVLRRAETGGRRVVQEDLSSGPRIWKASEILGDSAVLDGHIGYGSVDDLIFTSDAKLHAVVVNAYASYRGGYRAFPFYGYPYGWAPGYPAYYLGYGSDDVVNLQVFDYDRIRNEPGAQQSGAGKKGSQNGTTGSTATPQKQPTDK